MQITDSDNDTANTLNGLSISDDSRIAFVLNCDFSEICDVPCENFAIEENFIARYLQNS